MRRRRMIANQMNDWYVMDGLLLHLDGIKNTRHGHDETTSVWEDLSPNQNDAILYNMITDYGYYDSTEHGYVFLHNDAYAETIRNIGLQGNDKHTVEIVAKPYSLDGVSDKPKGNGYLWFGSSGSAEGSSRCFRHKRNEANVIENTFCNGD